jgi:sulfite exporter TauE/SafE
MAGIAKGMAVMLLFGIGTIPALFLVAKLTDMGWFKNRVMVYRIGALLMTGVGLYFVVKGIRY